MGRKRGCRVLAALVTFVMASGLFVSPASSDSSPDWLQLINGIRVANGLQPVVANDAWAADLQLHLTYLANTPPQYFTGAYASEHTENPASPYYTAAGAAAGSASNLGSGVTDVAAIDGWLGAPFHAVGILRPGLKTVAFARDPTTDIAGLNVLSGLDFSVTDANPIEYPAPGTATDLPVPPEGEFASPLETCGWSSSGLAMVVLLPTDPTPDVSAELTRPDGSTISTPGPDLCVVTKYNYVTTDQVYGPAAASILASDHAVFVIPHTWLKPGTYGVRIKQSGQPDITWSFTSTPPPVQMTVGPIARTDCGSFSGTGYLSTSFSVQNDWYALDGGSRVIDGTVGSIHATGFTISSSASSYGAGGGLQPDRMLSAGASPLSLTLRDTTSSAVIASFSSELAACPSLPTTLRMLSPDETITAGSSVTIDGSLRQTAKKWPLDAQAVFLLRRGFDSGPWSTVSTQTTDYSGTAPFHYKPKNNSEFELSW